MSPLSSAERRALLALARQAIVEAVVHGRLPEPPAVGGALAEPGAAFVSLHSHGRLRGCIGQVEPTASLAETVQFCAVAAATRDPRFAPVVPEELDELEIEISVLSPRQPVRPEQIEPGVHGVRVLAGTAQALLLPQVATRFRWSRERFLEEVCLKAGLPAEAWRDPQTRLEAFTAEVFSEADFREESREQARAS
ncbi:MAG: AmmeMemoRadiSam system protein A [Acidobacteriia bacterium]|jgi:AmmeMemoRadiSam system protein A|nr:AmmeMemoRadiSam system protein A [Terriglobia bacterium]